jgi:hypothetical protein
MPLKAPTASAHLCLLVGLCDHARTRTLTDIPSKIGKRQMHSLHDGPGQDSPTRILKSLLRVLRKRYLGRENVVNTRVAVP